MQLPDVARMDRRGHQHAAARRTDLDGPRQRRQLGRRHLVDAVLRLDHGDAGPVDDERDRQRRPVRDAERHPLGRHDVRSGRRRRAGRRSATAGASSRRRPARWRGARDRPDRARIGRAPTSVDDGVALLPQELGDVVHRQAGLAGRAGALPAAERLDARPRARRRAGAPVDVQHARLDLVEEALDLGRVVRVDAGGQAVDVVVGELRGPRRASRPRATAVNGAKSSSWNSRCVAGSSPTTVGST